MFKGETLYIFTSLHLLELLNQKLSNPAQSHNIFRETQVWLLSEAETCDALFGSVCLSKTLHSFMCAGIIEVKFYPFL